MEGCPEGCPCPNWDCDAPPPGQVNCRARVACLVNQTVTYNFSVMTSMTTMISIDVKMVLLKSFQNALIHVVGYHHASLLAQPIMKMD